jgi:hypothetical protein
MPVINNLDEIPDRRPKCREMIRLPLTLWRWRSWVWFPRQLRARAARDQGGPLIALRSE